MSNSYEIAGKVKVVGEEQTFGTFRKKELVVTVEDGKYPQDISFEFVQDNIAKLDGVGVGDEVEVAFNIRGREYQQKWFNSLVGWKITGTKKSGDAPTADDAMPEESDAIPF